MQNKKCVYLVGTGPGDPELLTVKALRLIQTADVIVYDRLVSTNIIELIPTGVARIYVGKQSGKHTLQQGEINTLLVKLAQTNRSVVRLKGGDPLVFGRGSEEALYLRQHNVCFEIVPGITSASACTTYAGIPLTHRGLANQVHIMTGHCREDAPLDYDWAALAKSDTTLVIYMGVAQIAQITQELIAHGLPADTPAAAIEQGTTAQQRVCITNLKALAQQVEDLKLQAPVLFVIGKVVSLAEVLDWFIPEIENLHAEVSRQA
ncbi:MAG: uroporphyrinogen-III C-methyltransferase [Gammaproteobacteria bacterium]|nr:uroporphyrinogen-III C-methyltransferase [Gammaproteobacteria bacterium]